MVWRPGDVIRAWDRGTRPPKPKRLICIAPEKQRFLRINSKPVFEPNHPIAAAGAEFLHHDSFVELRQLVRLFSYDMNEADLVGRLNRAQAADIVAAAFNADTLTDDEKDLISECLGSIC